MKRMIGLFFDAVESADAPRPPISHFDHERTYCFLVKDLPPNSCGSLCSEGCLSGKGCQLLLLSTLLKITVY